MNLPRIFIKLVIGVGNKAGSARQVTIGLVPFEWRLSWISNENAVVLTLGPIIISAITVTVAMAQATQKDLKL